MSFDPGGLLGPASVGFFWSPPTKPTTQPSPTFRQPLPLHNPHAATLQEHTYHHVSTYSLFNKANLAWSQSHNTAWCAPHYTTTTPSQWAFRLLAQNFLLATTRHLLISLHKATQPQQQQNLHVAQVFPPVIRNSILRPANSIFESHFMLEASFTNDASDLLIVANLILYLVQTTQQQHIELLHRTVPGSSDISTS